jgi:hypothetical protein
MRISPMRLRSARFSKRVLFLLLPFFLCGVVSCGPVYTGLQGMSRMMPEDAVVKCPYCHKQISERDSRCPYCNRDVQFDLGTDAYDKEIRQLDFPD